MSTSTYVYGGLKMLLSNKVMEHKEHLSQIPWAPGLINHLGLIAIVRNTAAKKLTRTLRTAHTET